MSQERWTAVDRYFADLLVRPDPAVDAALAASDNVTAMRKFCELLAAEPRVTATAIQTVGTRGYDAFAIALVTA